MSPTGNGPGNTPVLANGSDLVVGPLDGPVTETTLLRTRQETHPVIYGPVRSRRKTSSIRYPGNLRVRVLSYIVSRLKK